MVPLAAAVGATPRRSSATQALAGVAAIAAGAARQRWGDRPTRRADLSAAVPTDPAAVAPGGPGWSRWIAGPALAVGLAAQGLGRTGGPWCRPDSLLQPHALWHVLTAGALWARSRRTAR